MNKKPSDEPKEKVKDNKSTLSNNKRMYNSTTKQTDRNSLDRIYFISSDFNYSHILFPNCIVAIILKMLIL